ncbi:MAG TPA: ATP phosphoribosyltransferase regulatory subunit, partial [Gammaproteobacteria bacterium]|nr:ATP phosphoribosyltransferase regulatory subunit [Gammaproteobacteria bacterium]
TGLVFAVYMSGYGRAIANGGRYDDIGKEFGRARPATGFSLDLREVSKQATIAMDESEMICAPYEEDEALMNTVRALRESGRQVVFCYEDDQADMSRNGASRLVKQDNDTWVIESQG